MESIFYKRTFLIPYIERKQVAYFLLRNSVKTSIIEHIIREKIPLSKKHFIWIENYAELSI